MSTTLTKFSMFGYKSSADAFTVTATVYAVDGNGNPTGAALGSDSLNNLDFSGTPGWVEFTFSPSITVEYGTSYFIILASSHGTDPYWRMGLTDNIEGLILGAGWASQPLTGRVYIAGALALEDLPFFLFNFSIGANSLASRFLVAALKPTTPTPADTATGIKRGLSQLSWANGGGAATYNVYFGTISGSLTLVSLEQAATYIGLTANSLNYNTTYYWRVDAVDASANIVTGDEWRFTTEAFAPPVASAAGSATPNMMVTQRRLLAAADNKLFYET